MQVLAVLVEDSPGVLARIASLFSRRAYNISSLSVGASEIPGRSRLTIVVDVAPDRLHQVMEQLRKLLEVVSVQQVLPLGVELAVVWIGSEDPSHLLAAGAREAYPGVFELTGPSAVVAEVVASLPPEVRVARSGLVVPPAG